MAKSLQEFREWAVRQGQVSNPTTNKRNQYPGQCVSLIQQYVKQVFGQGYKARGHAKDYIPPTFKRVTGKVKPGDVVRYGHPYGIVGGMFYGHIGMIDDQGKYLDQNGVVAYRVGRRGSPFAHIESIWRPTRSFKVKKSTPKKSNDAVANEIVAGKGNWGTGAVRVARLTARGYNATKVQQLVNQKMAARNALKATYYTVRRGDSLSAIAARYGSTVDQIVGWNGIKNRNVIIPGWRLRVK